MNRKMLNELLAAACSPPVQGTDGMLSQRFCFTQDFIGFAGHFPGYPIVPAVTQLLAAQQLIEQSLPQPVRLQTVSHAKFLQQLLPEQTLRVECREKAGKLLCYDARIYLGEELASSFRLDFKLRENSDG